MISFDLKSGCHHTAIHLLGISWDLYGNCRVLYHLGILCLASYRLVYPLPLIFLLNVSNHWRNAGRLTGSILLYFLMMVGLSILIETPAQSSCKC